MSTEKYLIAGLKVLMTANGNLLLERSRKYLSDFEGEPDIVIDLEPDKLEMMRQRHPTLQDEALEYLATGTLFYYRMLKFQGFMLHSSCIGYDSEAYIFSADSGTGKSTHTSLWQKYIEGVVMINDDKPAVRLIDGVFYAIGTPWSGKHDENCDIAVPLKAVALLKRGAENKIYPAKPIEAIPFLLRQTVMSPNEENMTLLTDLLDKFFRTVPVYWLECDMSEQAVITSFEKMTEKKYIKRK